MKAIYLIGFMGSGKTTVGRALAKRLQLPVIDTDEEITKFTGKTISEIFKVEGESHFRILEAEMVRRLPVVNSIITTGGGIILREENRKWMKENGEVVFLYASPEETLQRLEGDQTRPLLLENKKASITNMIKERLPLYLEATNIKIDTTGKSINVIVQEIEQRLKIE
ncbi:MAG TPA: shikimate kinase [Pseudoneobacillus sp.]|nr:shikimate kinase [Pseudoneobacillus sp.]